jgi:hypothetical protein
MPVQRNNRLGSGRDENSKTSGPAQDRIPNLSLWHYPLKPESKPTKWAACSERQTRTLPIPGARPTGLPGGSNLHISQSQPDRLEISASVLRSKTRGKPL